MEHIEISHNNNDGHIALPRIGMRIIKSAIGVFLCYVINALRGGNGTVFYSLLAVLWCMQDYSSETKKNARQRIGGTVIGAFYGLIFILIFRKISDAFGIGQLKFESYLINLLYGLAVSVSIIIIIYTTVLINKKKASYFSCVVFLSIVVNHIIDDDPYLFVFNRLLDTLIGIVLAIIVNCGRIPRTKKKDVLFISGLDDTLLAPNGTLSDYCKVELNRLLEDGLNFTVSTIRTPASLLEPLRDIRQNHIVITMDGAALFDLKENRYEFVYTVSSKHSKYIMDYFTHLDVPYFANVIVDDTLLIYYQESEKKCYRDLIDNLRSSPLRNYICKTPPDDAAVVYFMIIDKTDIINDIYEVMLKNPIFDDLRITLTDSNDYPGYTLLKIYNHNATKENMLGYLLRKTSTKKTVTFGTIKDRYDHYISPGDFNTVVKKMKSEYEPPFYKK